MSERNETYLAIFINDEDSDDSVRNLNIDDPHDHGASEGDNDASHAARPILSFNDQAAECANDGFARNYGTTSRPPGYRLPRYAEAMLKLARHARQLLYQRLIKIKMLAHHAASIKQSQIGIGVKCEEMNPVSFLLLFSFYQKCTTILCFFSQKQSRF